MRDWLGNEIKDGDTILHIFTKPSYSKMSAGFICPMDENGNTNTIFIDLPDLEKDDEFYWKEGKEYKVKELDGTFFYYFTDSEEITYYMVLETIHMFGGYDNAILAIRGKSDKKELYYENA